MNYTINEIPDEAVELSGTEMIPIWQGETKKVSVATLVSKGYIRDQNILSDRETVTITTTDTTMDYDGYLFVSVIGGPSPQSYALFINSDTYSLQNDMLAGGSYANGSYCFPFRKGDKIRTGVNATSSYYAQYYKLRDYTGR